MGYQKFNRPLLLDKPIAAEDLPQASENTLGAVYAPVIPEDSEEVGSPTTEEFNALLAALRTALNPS